MYIPDFVLSQDRYLTYGPLFHIGWLDGEFPFTKGPVPFEALAKLQEWTTNHDQFGTRFMRGKHFSNLPDPDQPVEEWYGAEFEPLAPNQVYGNGEIHLLHEGRYYAAPMMIYYYIRRYGYQPPKEFIDAVMHGEIVPESEEWPTDEYWEEEKPRFLEIYELLGQDKRSEAWQKMEAYIKLYPNTHVAYGLRGTMHHEDGAYEQAIQDVLIALPTFKFLISQPHNDNAQHNYLTILGVLVDSLVKLKRFREALTQVEGALTIIPEDEKLQDLHKNLSRQVKVRSFLWMKT